MPPDEVCCVRCGHHLRELAVRNVYMTNDGPICGSCIDLPPAEDDGGRVGGG